MQKPITSNGDVNGIVLTTIKKFLYNELVIMPFTSFMPCGDLYVMVFVMILGCGKVGNEKTMSSTISEIFLNNQFECRNYACRCDKDIENVAPGESPRTTLKVYCDAQQPLDYSYVAGDGLNLTGKNGGTITRNILGKLLAIKDGEMDSHIDFMESYGFLLPISDSSYESVDSEALMEVVNRIKSTIRLMNALAGEIDYKSILINTSYLLYSTPTRLCLSSGEYTTCVHPFTEYLGNYLTFPDLQRNQEVFGTGKLTIPDTLTPTGNPLEPSFITAIASSEKTELAGSNDLEFKHLFAMYTTLHNGDEQLRRIIDFFYHYQTEVGVFREVKYRKISYYGQPARENYTTEMKAALVDIAKTVLSEEINHNIQGIHLQYDGRTLTPMWRVDTLLQALYFSIFYMKPGVEIYKQCENPNCKRQMFFLTNATKTNKRYCCDQCRIAAATQRSRMRKKQKQDESQRNDHFKKPQK